MKTPKDYDSRPPDESVDDLRTLQAEIDIPAEAPERDSPPFCRNRLDNRFVRAMVQYSTRRNTMDTKTARAHVIDNRVTDLLLTISKAGAGGDRKAVVNAVYDYLINAGLLVDLGKGNPALEAMVATIHEKGLDAPETAIAITDVVTMVPAGSDAVHVLVFALLTTSAVAFKMPPES